MNEAGQKSHGIAAAKRPAVGWYLAKPSENDPKPYIAPAKNEPADAATHRRLSTKLPKQARETFTMRRYCSASNFLNCG